MLKEITLIILTSQIFTKFLNKNITKIKITNQNYAENECLKNKDFKNPYSLIEEIKYLLTTKFTNKNQIKLIYQRQDNKGFLFVFKLTNLNEEINFCGFYYNSRISKIKNFIFSDSLKFINNSFVINSNAESEIFCENILENEKRDILPEIDCNKCPNCKECDNEFFKTEIQYIKTPGLFKTEEIFEKKPFRKEINFKLEKLFEKKRILEERRRLLREKYMKSKEVLNKENNFFNRE